MTTGPAWLRAVGAVLLDESPEPPMLPKELATDPAFSKFMFALYAVAIERRFRDGVTYPEVIGFVADMRARTRRPASIDPMVAEQVIMAVFDQRLGIDATDPRVPLVRGVIARRIIADAKLPPAEFEALLERAWAISTAFTSGPAPVAGPQPSR